MSKARELSDKLCDCGCGQRTYVAPITRTERGQVKGEPMRFLSGHSHRWKGHEKYDGLRSDRLCECGCGEFTFLSTRTDSGAGVRRGEPLRYLPRHMLHERIEGPGPNPSGLCMCGCGNKTPIAKASCRERGDVGGTPTRYFPNHQTRKSGVDYIANADGCWIWQLAKDGHGYGVIRDDGRLQKAHRWMYERFVGPIPERHDLHHRCETPACVNPDHLEPLTRAAHKQLHAALAA